MMQILSGLIQFVFNALKYLLGFLAMLILGIVGATLYALPWLLRLAAILIWLAAAYFGFQTVQIIYSPFSQFIPILSLQFVIILLMAAWVIAAIMNKIPVWGVLILVGLAVGSVSYGALWLLEHWRYALPFFGILPVSVLVTGMIHTTLRGRALRKSKTISTQSEMNVQPDIA